MDVILSEREKQKNKAKREEKLDENEADPVSFTLYRMTSVWFLESKNIFFVGVHNVPMVPAGAK